jgi:hypothetical protein
MDYAQPARSLPGATLLQPTSRPSGGADADVPGHRLAPLTASERVPTDEPLLSFFSSQWHGAVAAMVRSLASAVHRHLDCRRRQLDPGPTHRLRAVYLGSCCGLNLVGAAPEKSRRHRTRGSRPRAGCSHADCYLRRGTRVRTVCSCCCLLGDPSAVKVGAPSWPPPPPVRMVRGRRQRPKHKAPAPRCCSWDLTYPRAAAKWSLPGTTDPSLTEGALAGASGRGTSSARSTPASRTPRPSAWSCGVRSCIENAAGTPTGLPRRHTPPQSATTHPWAHIAQQACRSSQLGLLGRLGRRLKLEIWVPVLPAPPGSGRARWFRLIGLRLRRRLVGTSVAPGRPSGPPALGALGRRLPHGHRARALAAWTAHFPVHPSAFPDLLDFSRPGRALVQGSGILGWFRVAGPIRTVMWLGQHAPAPLPIHRYVEQGPRGCVRCSMSKPSFRYSAMGRPRSSSRCHDKVRCVRRTTETLGSGSTPVNAARK